MSSGSAPGFYEFFSGGGMARLGLKDNWRCVFANDICNKKAAAYKTNFPPARELFVADVAGLAATTLPPGATLAWASFPCQDLSLAGARQGLQGERSGTFWPFWGLMRDLAMLGRPMPLVVLENVVGALHSHAGKDIHAIFQALNEAQYHFGPLVIDAESFVPQSRPRLFIIAVHKGVFREGLLSSPTPDPLWHTKAVLRAFDGLPADLACNWLWWDLPHPPARRQTLADIIEWDEAIHRWHTTDETMRLLYMMTPVNRVKINAAMHSGKMEVGAVYRRTRAGEDGIKRQRAEVRFDGVSGCLRTPGGGSSRQTLIFVNGTTLRSRLLSGREAARLMGVPEMYKLPDNYNEAYHLFGDGLVVPVVQWLDKHLLSRLFRFFTKEELAA